jgi:uncharacterized repeat protein (TIGR01451 family)
VRVQKDGTVPPVPVRAGSTVTFRLELRNEGLATARRVVACDRVPAGLRIIRAPGAEVRGRRACWRVRSLNDERTFHLTVQVSSRARGMIRNVLRARAANAGNARAVARIRVRPAFDPCPPAVTGRASALRLSC